MKIKSINSSSKGCAYIVESNGKQLLIDCGVPLKRIRKALNHDLSNVVGCLVSHEHGDHSEYLPQLEKETDIKIYCTYGTQDQWNIENYHWLMDQEHFFTPGLEFCIWPLKLQHDVECFGFLVRHKTKNLFYATDTSEVNYKIPGLNYLMIECNHSSEKLIETEQNKSVVKRICETHLSIENVLEFVKNHPDLEEIWLLHLSSRHSDAKLFKEMVQNVAGCIVHVADE
jgi:phosphoribosyl 1,2-cyclic phosphodiesterase